MIDILTEGTVIPWAVVVGISLAAAIWDFRTRRIPNALVAPVFAIGLVWAVWVAGLPGFAEAVEVSLLLSLPFILLFLFSHGGAGDAKLMGAIGTWLGLRQGIVVLCAVLAAGLVLSLATAVAKRRLKIVMANIFFMVCGFLLAFFTERRILPHAAERVQYNNGEALTIPYGVAIFAGVCAGGVIIWLR
jgi:prepilin peptidase CpaA